MTKSDLVIKLFEQQRDYSEQTVKLVVDKLVEQLQQALINGNRIEIRGFGAFTVPFQRARTSRNPKTGESLVTKGKYKIRFKPGKELRDRVSQSGIEGKTIIQENEP